MHFENNVWFGFVLFQDVFLDETAHQTALHDAFMETHVQSFTGRKMQVKQAVDTIQTCKNGVVMVTGKSGCGKTAFMVS